MMPAVRPERPFLLDPVGLKEGEGRRDKEGERKICQTEREKEWLEKLSA